MGLMIVGGVLAVSVAAMSILLGLLVWTALGLWMAPGPATALAELAASELRQPGDTCAEAMEDLPAIA